MDTLGGKNRVQHARRKARRAGMRTWEETTTTWNGICINGIPHGHVPAMIGHGGLDRERGDAQHRDTPQHQHHRIEHNKMAKSIQNDQQPCISLRASIPASEPWLLAESPQLIITPHQKRPCIKITPIFSSYRVDMPQGSLGSSVRLVIRLPAVLPSPPPAKLPTSPTSSCFFVPRSSAHVGAT